jgi:streptomycin 6-kinase
MNDIAADSYQWSEPRDSKAPDLKPYVDLAKALAEKDRAYQQLMEKAIRFARYIKDEFTYDDDPRFIEADDFLQSPEVQAWKDRKP